MRFFPHLKRCLVISNVFEHRTDRAADHVDHGDEGLFVAVTPRSGAGFLEKTIQPLQPGIGIGLG